MKSLGKIVIFEVYMASDRTIRLQTVRSFPEYNTMNRSAGSLDLSTATSAPGFLFFYFFPLFILKQMTNASCWAFGRHPTALVNRSNDVRESKKDLAFRILSRQRQNGQSRHPFSPPPHISIGGILFFCVVSNAPGPWMTGCVSQPSLDISVATTTTTTKARPERER